MAETQQIPALVAVSEVPGFIGNISRSTVYELIDAGELRRTHIGSRAFVSGESIAAFLDKVLSFDECGVPRSRISKGRGADDPGASIRNVQRE